MCILPSAGERFFGSEPISAGINGQLTGRHSMGLSNVTYYESGAMFWDERATSIEDQALKPIQSPTEMGSTLNEVVGKLSQTTFYPTLFQAAFGTPEVTSDRIAAAIANLERSMVSYKSKFDTAFAPGSTTPNFAAVFTPQEQAGEALFEGAAVSARVTRQMPKWPTRHVTLGLIQLSSILVQARDGSKRRRCATSPSAGDSCTMAVLAPFNKWLNSIIRTSKILRNWTVRFKIHCNLDLPRIRSKIWWRF